MTDLCRNFSINHSNVIAGTSIEEENELEKYLNDEVNQTGGTLMFTKLSYLHLMKDFMNLYKSIIEVSKIKNLGITEIDEQLFSLKSILLNGDNIQSEEEETKQAIWKLSKQKKEASSTTFDDLYSLSFNSYLTCKFLESLWNKYSKSEERNLILQNYSIDIIKEETSLVKNGDIENLIFSGTFDDMLPDLLTIFYENDDKLKSDRIFIQHIISGMEMCLDYKELILFNNMMHNVRTNTHLSTINQGTFGTFDLGCNMVLDKGHDYNLILCKSSK